ncbi:MAG TPA: NUDIX domain-containing protein [Stackebrandtia sp.]|uniref:bifunctional NUDIX hydrolase/histidine phosphatase family protein n=1 Tax=Stackebrandtia sp. TaxID=2023065 RepID=UPI002D43D629|nr:NUDIX domain-containing protein [Stackebrandtia sp.]HZE40204.1 NUDIX domain-containing protein [Stackebrandtia sp.]
MDNRVLAAGGVLWRTDPQGSVEVAGVFRPATGNWSLPKGKLDNGEHPLAAACREVAEETGHAPIPQTFLTTAHYTLSHPDGDVTKSVDFWSMRAANPAAEFAPTEEVTKQEWFRLDDARATLTRPRDQEALNAFRKLPTVTATVVLLRHARPEAPESFRGIDVARPLDPIGRSQATQLATLLSLYDPQRIVSATPQRCVKTVAPLASALSMELEGESVFDADAHFRNPERAPTRLRDLAADGGGVVCSQAPVIADSLAILADSDGIELHSVNTPVAGVWVLSFAKRTLVAVERL